MAERRYRAAAIGHTGRGGFGHGLHRAFRGVEGVEMVAVADPDPDGRARAQAEAEALRGYPEYREMLAREELDLVSVGPRWLDQRLAMVLACIDAGCHVYCEKPFAISLEDGDRMVAAARAAGVKIAVGHFHGAYLPGADRLKALIDAGRIGGLQELHAHGKHDHRGGGEDMMDLGIHLFNLMQYLAGDALWVSARVTVEGRDIEPADVHEATEPLGPVAGDRIDSYIAFAGGVAGLFDSKRHSVGVNERYGMEIVGSEGIVSLRGGSTTDGLMIYPYPLWAPARVEQRWQPLDLGPPPEHGGHYLAVTDLIDAVEQGREPLCSGCDGVKALELVLAPYAAQIAGARVALPMADRRHPLDVWRGQR
ncbi:MAG: Gfo/Idh/MocA family oxidoreductase [Spirochaetaceae bacterium]|nr:Gfo/Idh/MocA family oxidoreductase [Spirochaetaceae bacterium]